MDELLEMTVTACYNQKSAQRIRMLKLLRIALLICLFMAWTYGIAVAAAFVQEESGAATLWMLQFVMFTIPATVVLILAWVALNKLSRVYDYCMEGDCLEIWNSKGSRRKLVVQINCCSMTAFSPEETAPAHTGRVISAAVSMCDRWVLDVRHEGFIVRVLLQPNEEFIQRLKKYVR